ncbi:PD-(D/E)XK nuclease family protein [Rhodopirellula sp. P2]|uniref:PD-(D/E)XK nuclease family protein n=1 Tax=Rhodopirellula sp. P2 TaxID=2127060 RepID=UPI002367A775|nr:PD-(D/E)XK nuclease family protein [Rhodopirellula sp. P2]WDQ14619.1 PD-(D/E)XK nuclease family protein [Rhodopirellula sp. P2]
MTQTIFLGWNQPLLVSSLQWLKETNGPKPPTKGDWDLSHLDLVFPSRRAIDRMRELLLAEANAAEQTLRPPRMLTVGDLPSRLYESDAAALDFEQTLAWARVLAAANQDDLSVLISSPPAPDAADAWLELGGTMRRLHNSIAAEGLTYADVLEMCDSTGERRRWQFFVDLMKAYLAELAAAGKADPNEAQLDAIRQNACRATRPMVLIGTTDISKLLVSMLGQVESSKQSAAITALVAAPASHSNRFDSFGNLNASRWQSHCLPLQDGQLIPAGEISDQTAAVMETLAEFGQKYRVDQITIGVTDESQVEPIENRCDLLGVATHRHLGHRVGQTAVGRLMHLVVTYLQRRTWRSLAALVRHADVTRYVSARCPDHPDSEKWLRELDQLLSSTFPRSVDEPLPEKVQQSQTANQIREVLDQWLSPLIEDSAQQPIRQWSEVLQAILIELYGEVAQSLLPADNAPGDEEAERKDETSLSRTEQAIRAVFRLLDRFTDLSPSLDEPVDGAVAIEMLSSRMSEVRWVEDPSPTEIELLGWLDLALDDSPALVVCGLNHPFVPEAQSGDPFLPQSLRSTLHQSANDRRYARDVHAMQQLLTSRETVRFLVGSHSADGSPTPPSRLLAAATPEEAAKRVCDLLTIPRPKVEIQPIQPPPVVSVDSKAFFAPPPPEPGRTIQTLSVTAFSAYLACPYRFYLRHVLRLRPLDDSPLELAANQFGDLVHGALEEFGDSDYKNETDPKRIEEALIEELHRYAAKHFGDNTSTTVKLQVRQAQRRLKTVALRQAERAAAGWLIHAVEDAVDEKEIHPITGKPKKPTGIVLDGEFTGLRGRFDRIDFHPETGRWAILDYKTHGHKPEKKHLKKLPDGSTQWVDLQLPLYRRFIPDLGIDADPVDVELGYFNVAEKDTETQINLAEFTAAQFAAADELIHHCVREIRACHFEPNPNGVEFDDYEMLMNESVFIPMDDETEAFE